MRRYSTGDFIGDDYIFEGSVVIGSDSDEYILLDRVSRDEFIYPTLYLRLVVMSAGMRGVKLKFAIGVDMLQEFLAEFTMFEERRTGKVTLTGMSWNEFSLTFEVVHPSGDIDVQAVMQNYTWGNNGFIPCILNVRFPIDPTSLPYIRDQFREMIAFEAPKYTGSETP